MKEITIDSIYNVFRDTWEISVRDRVGHIIEYVEYTDEEFEDEVQKVKKKYEERGSTVEISIS